MTYAEIVAQEREGYISKAMAFATESELIAFSANEHADVRFAAIIKLGMRHEAKEKKARGPNHDGEVD